MISRVLTGLVGLGVWAWGLRMFVEGDEVVGGVVILGGGALIVIALQGGWSQWWEGLSNWLYHR